MLSSPESVAVNRGGIFTALSVVTAPKAAFRALRSIPTWGWAYLVAALLAVVGSLLQQPAWLHYADTGLIQKATETAQRTASDPTRVKSIVDFQVNMSKTIFHFTFLLVPIGILLGSLFQAVVMLVVAKVAKAEAHFKNLWAAAINISIVTVGLATLTAGIITLLRGPDAFTDATDIYRASPSLAWLVPNGPIKLTALLSALNAFAIWGGILTYYALTEIVRVGRTTAIVGSTILVLIAPVLGAAVAQ